MRRDRDRADGLMEEFKIVMVAIKTMADAAEREALALEDIDHYNRLLGGMMTLTKLHDVLIQQIPEADRESVSLEKYLALKLRIIVEAKEEMKKGPTTTANESAEQGGGWPPRSDK